MTDHETECIKELSGDVKELSGEVRQLASDVRDHITRDEGEWQRAKALSIDVWGVEGDPGRPGLKGQMRDVQTELDTHATELKTIRDAHKDAKSRGLTWLSGATLALLGAIFGALAKHFW